MFDFLKQLGKALTDGMGLNAQPNNANKANLASTLKPETTKSPSNWASAANSALSGISVSSANSVNNAPPHTNNVQIAPDKPVPFGYKNSWLCIKADSPEEVIAKMGLKNPRVSNWNDGVYGNHNDVFVSPVLDGYVLVVRWEGDILDTNPARLDELAKKFTELQFFSTHRVSDYHVWAKYVGGEMIRGYGYCGGNGEVFLNNGGVTPEEEELGLDNLIPDSDADWDSYDFPDEENVLEIAAAWGIDTLFHKKTYPESTGYLCDVG